MLILESPSLDGVSVNSTVKLNGKLRLVDQQIETIECYWKRRFMYNICGGVQA